MKESFSEDQQRCSTEVSFVPLNEFVFNLMNSRDFVKRKNEAMKNHQVDTDHNVYFFFGVASENPNFEVILDAFLWKINYFFNLEFIVGFLVRGILFCETKDCLLFLNCIRVLFG